MTTPSTTVAQWRKPDDTTPKFDVEWHLNEYIPGTLVDHATFGKGKVTAVRAVENDVEVTVSFADRERRLLASFARLKTVYEEEEEESP